jgi:xylose isomerase
MTSNNYQPRPEHKFTFGLWTVGNRGRDPFGEATRPSISPVTIVKRLSELGAYGVNLHDNDLLPIDATPSERDRIVREFKQALDDYGMKVPMATTNLFYDPVFKDGAFTSSDPRVRLYALQKTMRSMDLGAELGAKIYVFWGGREGAEVDAAKDPREALKWNREAFNFLCEYSIDQGYDFRFALEAKPNEPRGDIYLPTTGAMLAFIATLDHADMVGVNPEVGHEQMSGLNFYHVVAQAIEAGKLFHIDLNDQKGPRFDQDLRFGSESIKNLFFLVRLLESAYDGPRHFDAHSYRSENEDGVWAFAAGCMRNYLILKEKARQFDEDKEVSQLLAEIRGSAEEFSEPLGRYSSEKAKRVKELSLDRAELASKPLPYERLDQLTVDILLGVR